MTARRRGLKRWVWISLACFLLLSTGCKKAASGAAVTPAKVNKEGSTAPARPVSEPSAATVTSAATEKGPLTNFDLKQRAVGSKMAVATAHPLATRAAIKAMYFGGSAIDALVAASMMLTVVTPESTGIGGGGFAVVWPGDKRPARAFDFREQAPAAGVLADYLDEKGKAVAKRSRAHGLAVGVPGYVAGLHAMHRKYGVSKWRDLVLPAAEVAERGFRIGQHLASSIEAAWPKLGANERAILSHEGKPLVVGGVLEQPALARTLRSIAEQGPSGFYQGAVAKEILSVVKSRGGKLAAVDLAAYRVREVAPLRGKFFAYKALTMPQPSAGGAQLLVMAEFAERFLAKVGKAKELGTGVGEVGVLHAFAEAMRRSFVLRFAYGGDTDKPAVRLGQLFPNKIRRKLQRSFRAGSVTPTDSIAIGGSTGARQRGNTSHVSIVDANGMAVASTHTINLLFGAGIVTPNGGVWLNNELDDFSFTLKDSNAFGLAGNAAGLFRAGARPPSSMTPTILLETGKPRLLIGAPGGTRIPTAVFQAAWWYLVAGLPLQQAVAKMRVHHQGFPDQIWLEEGAAADGVSKGLEGIGHQVNKVRPWCNIQAVGITSATSRKLEAVSDNRYEGGAMAL